MSNEQPDGNLSPEEIQRASQLGQQLVGQASELAISTQPNGASLNSSPANMQPLQWATDVVNLMAQRVDQVLKLSKEAAQGLSESSQLMLNTCKIMQAVIGEQAAVMQQLAEATSSIENAANALVNLYQDYQALMDQMLTQQEQQNQ